MSRFILQSRIYRADLRANPKAFYVFGGCDDREPLGGCDDRGRLGGCDDREAFHRCGAGPERNGQGVIRRRHSPGRVRLEQPLECLRSEGGIRRDGGADLRRNHHPAGHLVSPPLRRGRRGRH